MSFFKWINYNYCYYIYCLFNFVFQFKFLKTYMELYGKVDVLKVNKYSRVSKSFFRTPTSFG